MKIVFGALILSLIFSCKQEMKMGDDLERIASLQSELEQLKLDSDMKDSMMNESLAFFNEIQENLSAIEIKNENVRMRAQNPEVPGNEKEWILQEINHINFLRTENAKKVSQLQSQINKSGAQVIELKLMVEKLVKDIASKDEKIAALQLELNEKNQDYSKLFDAYQVKEYEMEEMTIGLNEAFYVYGTEKELIKNKVIEKSNGFIGIGKSVDMKQDFNQSYFTKIDIREKDKIVIIGKETKLVSTHPSNSYELTQTGETCELKIINPRDFWKITKYLIVTVK